MRVGFVRVTGWRGLGLAPAGVDKIALPGEATEKIDQKDALVVRRARQGQGWLT